MRFRLITLAAFFLSAVSAFAYEPRIRDIQVNACLHEDGSATVTEKWDVTVASGTEWYLVRSGLGEADIKDLNVFDENGRFTDIGRWDVDASLQKKAGKCGLNPIPGGYEICWGVGSYGDHKYTVIYRITDAVDLYDDADCFHFQLVSPGLSSRPGHVKVSVEMRGTQLDTGIVKFWGFGNEGTTCIENGAVCFEATEGQYTRNSSVITLLRFNKGLFEGGVKREGPFSQVLDNAMKGADFGTDEDDGDILSTLIGMAFTFLMIYFMVLYPIKKALGGGKPSRRERRKILGCNPKEVSWWRDVPYDGSIPATSFVLGKLGEKSSNNNIAFAMMLRMIYKGVLTVQKNAKGKTEFAISRNADISYMNPREKGFYDMLLTAAGEDSVLQDKEFSKWANSNCTLLYNWSLSIQSQGAEDIDLQGRTLYSEKGQAAAREALGFKKFLKDFTRMQEKQSVEAVLWQEYLVFAAMFGIADKVAGEMKDINPDLFARTMPATTVTGTTFGDIYNTTTIFSRSFNNAVNAGNPALKSAGKAASSWSGGGGFSSFGGGGGFHGGGFGGGSR